MGKIKEMFGIQPNEEGEQVYSPSKTALKMAVDRITDYDYTIYEDVNLDQNIKVLLIGTESENLIMDNGNKFLTGNHPVEMFVPMLHLELAGFEIDIATPSGKSLKLEQWAMPYKDETVHGIYEKYRHQIENPLDLREVAAKLNENSTYVAVFIPGGHGALIDLPQNLDVKRVLQWTREQNKYVFSICHGPAALLAASLHEDKDDFLYKGYKIAAFPDVMDKLLPATGYLPGKMPWYFGKKLEDLGMEIVNTFTTGKIQQDRKLITGDSPKAANELGRVAARLLLIENVIKSSS